MAEMISAVFNRPVTEKESLIKIVEMIKPEFRMTLWNSSVWNRENNNKITSEMIRIVKNCSKKMLFMSVKESIAFCLGSMIDIDQFIKE